MDYRSILEAGFERIEANDSVFFDIWGFDYFIMSKTVGEWSFEWTFPDTDTISVYKDGKPHGVHDAEDVLTFINILENGQKNLPSF
jgi:hypothetical protein